MWIKIIKNFFNHGEDFHMYVKKFTSVYFKVLPYVKILLLCIIDGPDFQKSHVEDRHM